MQHFTMVEETEAGFWTWTCQTCPVGGTCEDSLEALASAEEHGPIVARIEP